MLNWIKNIFVKTPDTNYVVAEYPAAKKKKRNRVERDPLEDQLNHDHNASGEYMKIDDIHNKT